MQNGLSQLVRITQWVWKQPKQEMFPSVTDIIVNALIWILFLFISCHPIVICLFFYLLLAPIFSSYFLPASISIYRPIYDVKQIEQSVIFFILFIVPLCLVLSMFLGKHLVTLLVYVSLVLSPSLNTYLRALTPSGFWSSTTVHF